MCTFVFSVHCVDINIPDELTYSEALVIEGNTGFNGSLAYDMDYEDGIVVVTLTNCPLPYFSYNSGRTFYQPGTYGMTTIYWTGDPFCCLIDTRDITGQW